MSSVPPGWYAAGVAGEERWWSGVDWTEHRRPIGQAAPGGPKPPMVFHGSYVGSIIAGAFCIPVALGILVAAALMFLGNPILGVLAFLLAICAGALAFLGFFNAAGLKRQEAHRAAATGEAPRPLH